MISCNGVQFFDRRKLEQHQKQQERHFLYSPCKVLLSSHENGIEKDKEEFLSSLPSISPGKCEEVDEEMLRTIAEMRERTDKIVGLELGKMSVEEFEDAEETATWWCTSWQQNEESVKQSLRIYERLIEEHEKNPSILEEEKMAHWLDGNYPRSLLLLKRILQNWRYYWIKIKEIHVDAGNGQDEGVSVSHDCFTPSRMLSFIDELVVPHSDNKNGGDDKSFSPAALPVMLTMTPEVPVTNEIYTIIIRGVNQRPIDNCKSETALFASRVLEHMLQQSQTYNKPLIVPDAVTFSTVMDTWAKSERRDAPQQADALLQRMITLYENGLISEPPNTVIYVSVMQAWYKTTKRFTNQRNTHHNHHSSSLAKTQRTTAERVEQLLHEMMHNTAYPDVLPDTRSFRLAIHSWLSCQDNETDAVHRAYCILKEMLNYHEIGTHKIQLDSDFFSAVIKACADRRMCDQAQELFDLQQALCKCYASNSSSYNETSHRQQKGTMQDDYERIKPDIKVFKAMIIAYSHSSKPGSAQKAEDMLFLAESMDQQKFLPKRSYYSDVINAWCNDKTNNKNKIHRHIHDKYPTATNNIHYASPPHRAEAILFRLVDIYLSTGNESMLPNRFLIYQVLDNWANHAFDVIDAPERAEAVLRVMQDLYGKLCRNHTKADGKRKGSNKDIDLGELAYLHVMKAWSRSKSQSAPDRATNLLCELQQRYDNNEKHVQFKPNQTHYTALLTTYIRNAHPDTGKIAQLVFNEVLAEDKNKDGQGVLGPAGNADTHYDQRFMPDTKFYGALVDAFAKVPDAKNAEAVLLRMIDECSHHVRNSHAQPDTFIFNRVLEAWYKVLVCSERQQEIQNTREEKKDSASTMTMDRMETIQKESPVDRAEFIFNNMKNLSESGILLHVQPDVYTYQFMVFIWSRQRKYQNGPQQAEKYLRMMMATIIGDNSTKNNENKQTQYSKNILQQQNNNKKQTRWTPAFESYTKTISAWVYNDNSNHNQNIRRAEQLFNELSDFVKSGKILPPRNKTSYTQLLKVIAKSGIPQKSTSAQLALKNNDVTIQPSLGLLPDK